ncbi:MAG: bifunctional UDP-N-acetylglucosamine diphosphorylase/glucosamine-1-phosphate N-acetyltransferase GlmU [Myxococcales bacterium]|nr:bifunctional UDP-N-acetylglucosamine diphosphorylase/glucosamine-1-phosphate N-acetyltransferase GlmU [Myxococcales bacterium]
MILAAGKGTRMRSQKSKVLHEVAGAPLVAYPVKAAQALGANPIVCVLGHQIDEVSRVLSARFGAEAIRVAAQHEQRGTGHAVALGLEPLSGFSGLVLILYGDVPLLRESTLARMVDAAAKGTLVMLTARVAHPSGYGRIVRNEEGRVERIVEDRDATEAQKLICEVNAGIYVAPAAFLREATAKLSPQNAQGELYLTDIVPQAAATIGVETVDVDPEEMAGINDRAQLVQAEAVMRARINAHAMELATLRAPETVRIDSDVVIEADVEIEPNVTLRGRTRIGAGAFIGQGCVLTDTVVGPGTEMKPYTVADQAIVGARCKLGPFAHLRPGTDLADDVHVGNFVETKKTRIGKGSKANHLAYLGDTIVGERVNIGAGTITCNYNGFEKRQTIIEDGAFIGSDTQLVAPVRVGPNAIVAAGATITQEVPAGALAITRVAQTHLEGYAARLKARYADREKTAAEKGKPPRTDNHD